MTAPPGRLLALGDIHGCCSALERLLAKVAPIRGDTVVVLGDCVNRGPDSKGVLDKLLKLANEVTLVPIMGNHEEELLAACSSPSAEARFASIGGIQTLMSYGLNATLDDIPNDHWRFMQSFLPYWETEDFFFTHANYDWTLPLDVQSPDCLRWMSIHEEAPRPHFSGKTAIVGHTANLSGNIVDFGFLRCIDTGCGLGGSLTMMDVRTKQIWQVPETP